MIETKDASTSTDSPARSRRRTLGGLAIVGAGLALLVVIASSAIWLHNTSSGEGASNSAFDAVADTGHHAGNDKSNGTAEPAGDSEAGTAFARANRRTRGSKSAATKQPGSQDLLPTRSVRATKADTISGPRGGGPKISKESIRETMKSAKPVAKRCYEKLLADFPDAGGRVVVKFRLVGEDGEGRVEVIEVGEDGTEVADHQLHDCLTTGIADLRFEAPQDGEVTVRYPLVFSPSDEARDE